MKPKGIRFVSELCRYQGHWYIHIKPVKQAICRNPKCMGEPENRSRPGFASEALQQRKPSWGSEPWQRRNPPYLSEPF